MKKIVLLLTLVLSMSLLAACSNVAVDQKQDKPKEPVEQKADEKAQESKGEAQNNEEKKDESAQTSEQTQDQAKEEKKDDEQQGQSVVKEGYRPGNLAKDVEFELWEDGSVVKLSDYKGQPVVLNFWASWCPHCVHELPAMNEAYKEYADKGLKVIAINLSFQDNADNAKKAMEKAGVEFITASDHTGAATSAFGVRGIPASVFIDKDGIIYENKAGAMNKEEFSELMKAIVE